MHWEINPDSLNNWGSENPFQWVRRKECAYFKPKCLLRVCVCVTTITPPTPFFCLCNAVKCMNLPGVQNCKLAAALYRRSQFSSALLYICSIYIYNSHKVPIVLYSHLADSFASLHRCHWIASRWVQLAQSASLGLCVWPSICVDHLK